MKQANQFLTLCAKRRVRVEYVSNEYDCTASRSIRRIRILPLINKRNLILAYHELMHVIGKRCELRLEEELRSWQLAYKYCPFNSALFNRVAAECLISYEEWADKRFTRTIAWKKAIVKCRAVIS